MWVFYQLLYCTALLTAGPLLLARRAHHYLPTLRPRLGMRHRTGRDADSPLWIHAVSVGEVAVAHTLARALPDSIPLLVTTVTPTGQARAKALFGLRATVAYLPFDLGFPVRRFFRDFSPRALVLVEGDYWPLVLRDAERKKLPIAVVNGRVGDRSFQRLSRFSAISRRLFSPVHRFGVQSTQDADRLGALGVDESRIEVTGNLKFEAPDPPEAPDLERAIREAASGRPILVAGSTMGGEEEMVLDAFDAAGGGERALLVLAPRHPERWPSVAELLGRRAVAFSRRSHPSQSLPSVLLLDTLGELASLYRIADAAFVGGTLVPTGGHNPLEPTRFGVPLAIGPSMENFRDMAAQFDRAEAWTRVPSAEALGATWKQWLLDPEAGRAVGARALDLLAANRGSLASTLSLLTPILETMR